MCRISECIYDIIRVLKTVAIIYRGKHSWQLRMFFLNQCDTFVLSCLVGILSMNRICSNDPFSNDDKKHA